MTVILLRGVEVLSFFVHVVCMNLTLGGGVLAGSFRLFSREGTPGREMALRLGRQLPVTLAATVLTGLLPLLARAELYDRYGYGAYVVAELPWVSVILLVLAASYGFYLFDNRSAVAWALGSSLAVAAIAFLFSSRVLLESLAGFTPDGISGAGLEQASIPRYLHFLVGGLSVGSAWVVWIGLGASHDLNLQSFGLMAGGRLFAIFTTTELVVGSWYLAALPAGRARSFMGGDAFGTALLVVALGFSVASMALLLRAPRAPVPRRTALSGLIALGGTLLFMMLVRQKQRDFGAAPAGAIGPAGSAAALLLVFVVIPVAAVLLLAFIHFREGRHRHADSSSSDFSQHAPLGRG